MDVGGFIAATDARSGAGVAPALEIVPARGGLPDCDAGSSAPNDGMFVGGFARDDADGSGGTLGTFMRDDDDEFGDGGMLGAFMRDDEDESGEGGMLGAFMRDDDGGGGTLAAFNRDDESDDGDFVRSGAGTIGRTGGGELGLGRRAGGAGGGAVIGLLRDDEVSPGAEMPRDDVSFGPDMPGSPRGPDIASGGDMP